MYYLVIISLLCIIESSNFILLNIQNNHHDYLYKFSNSVLKILLCHYFSIILDNVRAKNFYTLDGGI